MGIPKLENPPVEAGNKEDEGPGGEVDKDTCRRPDGLTKFHATCRQRNGIKVFQVVPEQIGPIRDTRKNSVGEKEIKLPRQFCRRLTYQNFSSSPIHRKKVRLELLSRAKTTPQRMQRTTTAE